MPRSQSGSVIIYLFILIGLFALLAYVFSSGSRSSLTWLEQEKADAAVISATQCSNNLTMATKRLEAKGCGALISNDINGANSNPGAPTDGSCSIYHVNGGGLKPCDGVLTVVSPCGSAPTFGQLCSDGTYYVGITPDGNVPFYAAAADMGASTWGSSGTLRGVSGYGQANTAALAAFGAAAHPAAFACDVYSGNGYSDWFLPSLSEETIMYNGGVLLPGINAGTSYWNSTEVSSTTARARNYATGLVGNRNKSASFPVRCVRKGL